MDLSRGLRALPVVWRRAGTAWYRAGRAAYHDACPSEHRRGVKQRLDQARWERLSDAKRTAVLSRAHDRGTARINYLTLLTQDLTAAVEQFYDDPDAPFSGTHALSPVGGCDEFLDYESAQMYYAAYPEEQPVIGPEWNGLACDHYLGGL